MPLEAGERRSQGSVHMDAIRGMAAIAVMLGHSRELFFESFNGHTAATATTAVSGMAAPHHTANEQITIGNEAVMIFFVLSGYLVGGSVLRAFQRNNWSWKEYLVRRLTRLWMVLLPALVLTVVLDHAGLKLFPEATSIYHGPPGQAEVRPNLIHTLTPGIIAGNAVFLQDIVVPTPGTNIALWSLSNEFWYYMIFPLLVIVFWRASTQKARLLSAFLAIALLYFIGAGEAILFPTWLFGAAIAVTPPKLSERASWWVMAGLMVLLLPVMFVVRRLPIDLHLAQTCIALYFGTLLYAVVNRSRPARHGIYQHVASVLSDLSYPLYLVHLPILVLLCAAINRPWHQWPKTPAHLAVIFALDMTTIVSAYVFHLCFQKHTEAVRLAFLRHYNSSRTFRLQESPATRADIS